MEVKRQLDVLDRRLAGSEYIAGADYTIADMAIWPWYGALVQGKVYEAATFLDVATYLNVIRWTETIGSRPAVRRGRLVNRLFGPDDEQMAERHAASDFDRYNAVLG
jgi:GST-like protein